MRHHTVEYRHLDGTLIWKATYRTGDPVPRFKGEAAIVGAFEVRIDGKRVE